MVLEFYLKLTICANCTHAFLMPKENASLAKTDIVIKFKHLKDIMTISNAKEFLIHLSAYNAKDTVLYIFI